MKYMGSKNRHAKQILPIILKDRVEEQYYVEPFVGGANAIDKVNGNRIGADVHPHLIILLKAMQGGWLPPDIVTEEEYAKLKEAKALDPLTGFAGFCSSFSGKWFGGYARDSEGKRNYSQEAKNNLLKQAPNLKGIDFRLCSYDELDIPHKSIIYCDPPYADTTKYKTGNFDHTAFWQWCDKKVGEGHTVFVSEYKAPDHWDCVWAKEVNMNLNAKGKSKRRIEKLFTRDN